MIDCATVATGSLYTKSLLSYASIMFAIGKMIEPSFARQALTKDDARLAQCQPCGPTT
jgi:hypothetical protein